MFTFDLKEVPEFRPERHVERILETIEDEDVMAACWEPGQIRPDRSDSFAAEVYLCVEEGGVMRSPEGDVAVSPGKFVVHPPGDVHEYVNGPTRSLLFRVRYGPDRSSYHFDNRGKAGWVQSDRDAEYFQSNPIPESFKGEARTS